VQGQLARGLDELALSAPPMSNGAVGGRIVAMAQHAGPPSLDALSTAARALDRGGLTRAGRSLTKHGAGARPGNTRFPPAQGSPGSINTVAENLVDDILTNPGTVRTSAYRGRFGKTIEFMDPSGRGLVYDELGNFLFFME